MQNRLGRLIQCVSALAVLLLAAGCADFFKPVPPDPVSKEFPTDIRVAGEDIRVFRPLAGIGEVRFVCLRTVSEYEPRFYVFMKDALLSIGFKNVYSEKELSGPLTHNGRREYSGTSFDSTDFRRLAEARGPFVIADAHMVRLNDETFRFIVVLREPVSDTIRLEISRVAAVWYDMDIEVNYPVLNAIKKWYDASAGLPY
jgi:hypothetical protein